MTIRQALAHGRSFLRATSPTPALDARLLLQYVLDLDHAALIARNDRPLTAAQTEVYQRLLERAQHREPIPYITGSAPFYDLDFHVTPAVLIPRPETEQLVDLALAWAKTGPIPEEDLIIADAGAGSGCIAVVLARRLPQATVYAGDVSTAALTVARQNAARLAPNRIHFYQGDLLSPLAHPLHLIVANLPYVTEAEWTGLDDGVKLYEPAVALKGGPDGLDLIDDLLQQATARLALPGAIFLEIGWRQGDAARTLAQTHFPAARVKVQPDFAGHDRFISIIRPTDKATTRPTDKATTRPTDKATTRPNDKATTRPTDEATTRPTDKATTRPTDKATTRPNDLCNDS